MGKAHKNLGRKDRAALVDASFQTLCAAAFRGRGVRSMLGRRIALAAWPEVFDTLDFTDDRNFLEPLLFVAGVMPEIADDLPKLLNPSAMPSTLRCDPYFIPTRGYLDVAHHCYQPVRSLHGINLIDKGIQGLRVLVGPYTPVSRSALGAVEGAVDMLAAVWPAMFSALKQSCRRIVPFEGSNANSFASESMPSTIFLNLSQGSSLAALLEDLTHQAMHCLFSDVEQGTAPYTKPPGDPLRQHGCTISANRTISVLHHSCLTLAASCHALEGALGVANLTTPDRVEMQARIGFVCRKMALDLSTARYLDALEPEWRAVFWALMGGLRPRNTFANWQYSSQGYNFSFEDFCDENRDTLRSVFDPHPQQV